MHLAKSWLSNTLPIFKHIPQYARLTVQLSRWPLSSAECSCEYLLIINNPIIPCKLPYNKLTKDYMEPPAFFFFLVSKYLLSSIGTFCSFHPTTMVNMNSHYFATLKTMGLWKSVIQFEIIDQVIFSQILKIVRL